MSDKMPKLRFLALAKMLLTITSAFSVSGDPCATSPCVHGTCINVEPTDYRCECPPNYEGPDCAVSFTQCGRSCNNEGQCIRHTTRFCRCNPGKGGDNCDLDETANVGCQKKLDDEIWGTLESTSSLNGFYPVEQVKMSLHPNLAWCISTTQGNEQLKITFAEEVSITGIGIRGEQGTANYVSEMEVVAADLTERITKTSGSWTFHKLQKRNLNEILFQDFQAGGEYPCMQIELYGCRDSDGVDKCFDLIGISDYADSLFTTNGAGSAHEAKFYNEVSEGFCAANNKYVKINIPQSNKTIVGVITRGKYGEVNDYVSEYEVKAGGSLVEAAEKDKLSGNHDSFTPVTHFFDEKISLKSQDVEMEVKIKNAGCIALDFIGCEERVNPCNSYPCMRGGTCEPLVGDFQCTCIAQASGKRCDQVSCFENLKVDIDTVVFSSVQDTRDSYGLTSSDAWCITSIDANPFAEIQLSKLKVVKGIKVSGESNLNIGTLVGNFGVVARIFTSERWDNFTSEASTVLTGVRKTGSDIKEYIFDQQRVAYRVRIEFTNDETGILCMRFDLLGCDLTNEEKSTLCLNGGTYVEDNPFLCKCPDNFIGDKCEKELAPLDNARCLPTLGFGNPDIISEGQISADDNNNMKELARPRSGAGWCTEVTTWKPSLRVDFHKETLVFGISTQGHPTEAWTTEFKLKCGRQETDNLVGNTDGTTVVTNILPQTLGPCYQLQFKPYSPTKRCVRMELYGLNDDVMKQFLLHPPSVISDPQITASSTFTGLDVKDARINSDQDNLGWCSASNDGEQYVQIEFNKFLDISMIITKGVSTKGYTKTFNMNYTTDKIEWISAQQNGSKNFFGNINAHAMNYNILREPFKAIAVRFIPLAFNNSKCLQVDVYGCGMGCAWCDVTAVCNEANNFTCVCPQGSDGNGTYCEVPCDDCNGPHKLCDVSTNFTCQCQEGYAENGNNCTDLCADCIGNSTKCDNSTSYTCKCLDGFERRGGICKAPCDDCNGPHKLCDVSTNFTCQCQEGYAENGNNCTDLCADCIGNSTKCDNSTSYTCKCLDGFERRGGICKDLCADCIGDRNICQMSTNYTCKCLEGFTGNGTHCDDICENAGCHNLYASCNETSNYTCQCNFPYIGNGIDCESPCDLITCDQNANCSLDGLGVAQCSCFDGYTGNGTYCQDICQLANCHDNATCTITSDIGSCSCKADYIGNGTFCTGFHPWGNWSSCSETCGNSKMSRARDCVNLAADYCITSNTMEIKNCTLPPCATDGGWSNYTEWSTCSTTCGAGITIRNRTCTNPEPAHGGNICDGLAFEMDDCIIVECPGELGYGAWSNWTNCSNECGDGTKYRNRTCLDQLAGCTEPNEQENACFLKYCPVDGNWTAFGNWSTICSEPCGFGVLIRSRNCSNPAPAYNGEDCEGSETETKECSITLLCDGDYGFADWGSWSECDAECGTGSRGRSRVCSLADPGQHFCTGAVNETEECMITHCPVDGGFSNWTDWGNCSSIACGFHQVERTRTCSQPAPLYGGLTCSGVDREIMDCNQPECPEAANLSTWTEWSNCSVPCSVGVQERTRHCLSPSGDGCVGENLQTKECIMPHCPVDGEFSEWGSWSICPVTCGSGFIERKRACDNPLPAYNGKDCLGLSVEIQSCSMPTVCATELGFTQWSLWSPCNVTCGIGGVSRQRNCTDTSSETCIGPYENTQLCDAGPCPIDGQYFTWQGWSLCSGTCGSGLKTRTRACIDPEPAYGGSNCIGPDTQVEDCQNALNCSGESGYNQWSAWSVCTQTCGVSVQIRQRTCQNGSNPEDCAAISSQTKTCDMGVCPIQGGWDEWTTWSMCSVSCGSGEKRRVRSCTNPIPDYGGLPCYGDSDQYITCVMPEICPNEEEFSEWGLWSECGTQCGDGTRNRTRHCIVLPTYPPAEDPYCTLPTTQYIECNENTCPVDGNFTTWTGWSACSTTCGGGGVKTRYRNCTNPPSMFLGGDCLGHLYEEIECTDVPPCPIDDICSSWSSWVSCSATCEGTKQKTRSDLDGVEPLCTPINVTMACNTQPCPVDGVWSSWTSWSSCDATCGHQEEVRTRQCNDPEPRNGGEQCSGHDIEVMPCMYYDYIQCPDPPPAEWSDWSWWTVCNETCAGGRQERYRACNNPAPAPGYSTCDGEDQQEQTCNTHPCPIDGGFTIWSNWTSCSLECGNGTQVRTRLCKNPEPKYGGIYCEGDSNEQRPCNEDPCPIHGGFTQWSPWTFCNRPCGIGENRRKRSCTNPVPMYGGNDCEGGTSQTQQCNTHPCIPVALTLNVTFINHNSGEDITAKAEQLIQSTYEVYQPTIDVSSCITVTPDVKCTINLEYTSLAGAELVLLQDKLLDPNSETTLNSITSPTVSSTPLTATAIANSSTTINVEWSLLDAALSPSPVTGYNIFYKLEENGDYHWVSAPPADINKVVEELKKFTAYQIVVSPFSENGNGVPSQPLSATTHEDVPSVAPTITDVQAVSPTSLSLTWTTVDTEYHHGIFQGYCLHYSTSGSPAQLIETTDLTYTLTGLNPYTEYQLEVSAKTTPGCGVNNSTNIYTLEAAPTGPPLNVQGQNTSSTSILITWDNIERDERNGIILGFYVYYTLSGSTNDIHITDGGIREIEIEGLEIYTPYDIQVLGYNSVGMGPKSTIIEVFSDESTPSEEPEITSARNTSSTSIRLTWAAISPTNHRGILLGYRIYYRELDTNRRTKVITVDESTQEYHLTDLFMWWWYRFNVVAFTRVGDGPSSNISVRTDEEYPSRYPENIRGVALTSTSLSVEWDPVLPGFLHGELRGYKLTVRETENPSNIVVDTIVSPYERSYYLDDLKKYTRYSIWVAAINSRGVGPVYTPGHINRTGEDGPEFPPDDIHVKSYTHIDELHIEWTTIPEEFHNGILRGYYIEYTAVVLAGQVLSKDNRVVQSVRIRGNRYATILTGLDPASQYEVVIFGYTSKNGTKSNATIGVTCSCPKYMKANWFELSPYTTMFSTICEIIIEGVCQPCINGHGVTEFCYGDCDSGRKRRSSYAKKSQKAMTDSINHGYDVNFPVQGNKYITTYAGVFPYISVVDAPGSAYFTVKNVPSTAEVVVNASLNCIPMVILMSLFAWIAGIIMWILERKQNPDHFPPSFKKGVPEGFWWAFVSMTTVGYGDRFPITNAGRVFALVWVLMGLVIISIVTGGIVSSISSVLVVQEEKLYGAEVGAITDSSEYRKAIRQNSKVIGFETLDELLAALNNKDIPGALVDMYVAATKKSVFQDNPDIQMNRMVEYPTGFGIVLSGDMAKTAPMIRDYLAQRKVTVTTIVEDSTETLSQSKDEAAEAMERQSGLFDSSAPVFKNTIMVTMIMFAIFMICGTIYHFRWHKPKIEKKKKLIDALKETDGSLRVAEFVRNGGSDQLKSFLKDMKNDLETLKSKQIKEQKKTWLYKATKGNQQQTTTPRTPRFASSARITPITYDNDVEPSNDNVSLNMSTASLRQSSLSVFNEFKRQKSPRVHPTSPNNSTGDFPSSSISLRDLIREEKHE